MRYMLAGRQPYANELWHRAMKKLSLHNIFYSSVPKVIDCITNVSNILSEHDNVQVNIDTKEKNFLRGGILSRC